MLKTYFKDGALKSATIAPIPMESEGWQLLITKTNGEQEPVFKARTNIQKTYKQLRGAMVDAKEIGFREVTLVMY